MAHFKCAAIAERLRGAIARNDAARRTRLSSARAEPPPPDGI